MSPGDLVRIKNTAGTLMFYPEIVGKVGVLISVEGASAMPEAVKVLVVLVGEKMMYIGFEALEPA
ncbi:MAG: hypothetical protein EBZ49_08965 [Proteobacteria bacterium]|nr:hypothetical protein [Pseudomonadota bacterium]